MIVEENTKLIERRMFLIRGLNSHNITQEEYDAEVPGLEEAIKQNLAKRLVELDAELKTDINQIKQTICTDGDMKRAVAKMLIKFISPMFIDDEVRGIMRQGYKIMRGR